MSEHWSPKQRRALRLKSALYQIIDGVLFIKNYDGVFLRCLEHEDAKKVIAKFHDDLLEITFLETRHPIRFSELDITSLHYLRMLMLMLENVMLVRDVLEDTRKQ